MKKLERLKLGTKALAFIILVAYESKFMNLIIPDDPIRLRKLLTFIGTLLLMDLTIGAIFKYIDTHFEKIVNDVSSDAIGMAG